MARRGRLPAFAAVVSRLAALAPQPAWAGWSTGDPSGPALAAAEQRGDRGDPCRRRPQHLGPEPDGAGAGVGEGGQFLRREATFRADDEDDRTLRRYVDGCERLDRLL